LRRSKRIRKETSFGNDFYTYLIDNDHLTYYETISSSESNFWKEAIKIKIDSILQNQTWKLVYLPPGAKPIGCKWIFKRKYNPDGFIDNYKARLFAKGFTQKQNVDYFDTFAPVTRISSIRALNALASIYKIIVHQMDVKTAFLNGDLEEEIYMVQLEGCIFPGQENKVCKLVKSLYGLKQVPKQWYEKFNDVLLSNEFFSIGVDKCVYTKTVDGEFIIISLYVDDMPIFGMCIDVVNETKCFLTSKFDMKDMGEANIILGVRIIKNDSGLMLTQAHYVERLLKKYDHFDVKPVNTPYNSNIQLMKNKGDGVAQSKYAQIIESLMHLMNFT